MKQQTNVEFVVALVKDKYNSYSFTQSSSFLKYFYQISCIGSKGIMQTICHKSGSDKHHLSIGRIRHKTERNKALRAIICSLYYRH